MLSNWEWRIAPGEERAIWAVYPPKKIVSPKVKAFLAFLRNALATRPIGIGRECPPSRLSATRPASLERLFEHRDQASPL